ncbi:hypothetical protein [Enemella sp. A6]|uniref:WXG100-like domain-containing protein n=1 Tax=Enemella sp. A6 TaxID=3440152 RepID=UPI003EB8633C
MITPKAGPLVPDWVWESSFPEADETKLEELGQAWTDYGAAQSDISSDLAQAFENMSSHTGPGAEAAAAKAATVRGWLGTVIEASESLAETAHTAALLVTNAKHAINVVLANLQVSLTQLLMKLATAPVGGKVAALVQVRQLHIAAQAYCQAIAAALTAQLSALSPAVNIEPKVTTGKGGTEGARDEGDKYAPFNDTGLTPTSPQAREQAEQDARDLVGSTEHETATQSVDGARAATGESDNPWSGAAEQAFTEEERAAMQEQADSVISTGEPGGLGTGSLLDAAESVTEDEIDPELIQVDPPSGGAAEGGPLTMDEILGVRSRPDGALDEFEPGGPPAGQGGGPPPGNSTPGGSAPDTSTPGGSAPGGSSLGGPAPGADQPGSSAPAERPAPDRPAPSHPGPGGHPGHGGQGHGGPSHSGHQPPTQHIPSAPAPSAPPAAPEPVGTQPSGSSGPAPSYSGGSGGDSSGSSGDSYRPPQAPSAPGTSSAGVAAPPAQGGGTAQSSGPMVGGPMMGGAGGAPPPAAPAPAPGPNLTSAPMSMPAAPPAAPAGPMAGPTGGAPGGANPSTGPQPTPPPQQPQPTPKQPTTAAPIQAPPNQQQAAPAPKPGEGSAPVEDQAAKAGAGATVAIGAGLLGSVWDDLRRPAPPIAGRSGPMIAWPTQFGRADQPLATLPAGMSVAYQRVLLPGESEALLSGQVSTVRGMVHPLDHVRHLTTPAQLFDALGLGFVVNEHANATAAFDRRADWYDVLRFAGVRDRDLIIPLDRGVEPDDRESIAQVHRDHTRPWTGTGSAPGATSTDPIDEFEILGTRSLAVPHLAELWRIHSLGPDQHLATWDARTGTWQGPSGGQPQANPAGRLAENGNYATLVDGTTFRACVLTDRHTVLIAHGVQAPADFTPTADGSARKVVSNDEVQRWVHVTSVATWTTGPTPVHVLRRAGEYVLVDYAGDSREAATRVGFVQLAQGHWAPRWVTWPEIIDQHEDVKEFPNLTVLQSLG